MGRWALAAEHDRGLRRRDHEQTGGRGRGGTGTPRRPLGVGPTWSSPASPCCTTGPRRRSSSNRGLVRRPLGRPTSPGTSPRVNRWARPAPTGSRGRRRASSPASTARTPTWSGCPPRRWRNGWRNTPAGVIIRTGRRRSPAPSTTTCAQPVPSNSRSRHSCSGWRSALCCTRALSEDTQYYKHVDEVMASPAAWYGKRLQLHGSSSTTRSCRKRDSLDYRFEVAEQRAGRQGQLHRHRARHVQGRLRSRDQGHARARRLRGRAQRRDGQVPVEVRSRRAPGARSSRRDPAPGIVVGPALAPRDPHRHGRTRHVPPARRLRRLPAYAAAASRRRRAPPVHAADRERHRRVLSGRRADDVGVGGDHQRLPHRRLLHQVRRSATRTAQPLFYKITSYWGGLDGSIMFWVFLLSVFGAIAVCVNREPHRELIPYVVARRSRSSRCSSSS